MNFQEAKIENGEMIVTSSKEIDQSKMTSDCFMIQFSGLEACSKCEYKNTKECGGGQTLKNLKLIKN